MVGLAILVGIVGVVIPGLPGGLLVVVAILVWAGVTGTTSAWVTFAVATSLVAASQLLKYLLPGRRMHDAGIPSTSLLVGAGLGIVGFFVIPLVGLFVGFVLGVYVAERQRLPRGEDAWPSTRLALGAVGLSLMIELAGTLLAAATWLVAIGFVE